MLLFLEITDSEVNYTEVLKIISQCKKNKSMYEILMLTIQIIIKFENCILNAINITLIILVYNNSAENILYL